MSPSSMQATPCKNEESNWVRDKDKNNKRRGRGRGHWFNKKGGKVENFHPLMLSSRRKRWNWKWRERLLEWRERKHGPAPLHPTPPHPTKIIAAFRYGHGGGGGGGLAVADESRREDEGNTVKEDQKREDDDRAL